MFILDNTNLIQIRNTKLSYTILKDFWDNFIHFQPNKGIFLRDFSNLYVLIGCNSDDTLCEKHEKKWSDVLSANEYQKMLNNTQYILGFILIDDSNKDEINRVHYIEYIDTCLKGYNIADLMISKYQNMFDVTLEPKEIINSAVLFWKKRFQCDDHKLYEDDIDYYINEYNLDKNIINWTNLYKICNGKERPLND